MLYSRSLWWLWVSVGIIFIDQISKYYALEHLIFARPYVVLPVLNLTLSCNAGAAFSFLSEQSGWQVYGLSAVAVIVSCLLVAWLILTDSKKIGQGLSLSLIIGGALGNLIDRLRWHYVVDFIQLHVHHWYFATFNLSDSAITLGAILLVISFKTNKPN